MIGRTRVAGAALAALLLAVVIGQAPAVAQGDSLQGKVNVNSATLEELQLLPGIGESKARAIVQAREQRGTFESVEELLEVKGIGPASLEKLRPYLAVSGETTLGAP